MAKFCQNLRNKETKPRQNGDKRKKIIRSYLLVMIIMNTELMQQLTKTSHIRRGREKGVRVWLKETEKGGEVLEKEMITNVERWAVITI